MQESISQIERQKRFVIRFLYWGIMIGTLLFLGKRSEEHTSELQSR